MVCSATGQSIKRASEGVRKRKDKEYSSVQIFPHLFALGSNQLMRDKGVDEGSRLILPNQDRRSRKR